MHQQETDLLKVKRRTSADHRPRVLFRPQPQRQVSKQTPPSNYNFSQTSLFSSNRRAGVQKCEWRGSAGQEQLLEENKKIENKFTGLNKIYSYPSSVCFPSKTNLDTFIQELDELGIGLQPDSSLQSTLIHNKVYAFNKQKNARRLGPEGVEPSRQVYSSATKK